MCGEATPGFLPARNTASTVPRVAQASHYCSPAMVAGSAICLGRRQRQAFDQKTTRPVGRIGFLRGLLIFEVACR